MTPVQDSVSRLLSSELTKSTNAALPLALYAIAAIAMGPAWCLALSIPISLASTVVGLNKVEMVYLTGASVLASAVAYPMLRKPLTRVRMFGWPILFSLAMAIIFGAVCVFVMGRQGHAPGEDSIFFQLAATVFYGVGFGTVYWLGSIHVAYPMAMLHLWVLNRVLGKRGHPQNRV